MGTVPIFPIFLICLLVIAAPARAFEAGGVALGASEAVVKEHYPNAYCKPLEWKSEAAERRCDDGRVRFAGVRSRITFYLKNDAVEAFDVRFDPDLAKRVAAALKESWGVPASEGVEVIERPDESPRKIYKVQWMSAEARAVLNAEREKERAWLRVSRGDFEQEIYR